MCGLIGVVGRVERSTIDRALDSLAHRGPDGRGVRVHDDVVLGHRRLSVIDLSGGAQPMAEASGDLAIVFNGEIYNHLSLRTQLASRGHKFTTASDTETLLAMYREFGEACVSQLRGMFAFVIHDVRRNLLFGARDPFGKKPLYWRAGAADSIRFAIASEPRALIALWPAQRPGVSTSGIVSYFLHDYVTGVHSAFEGIRRIPPGTAFRIDLRNSGKTLVPEEWSYWSPLQSLRETNELVSESDAVEHLGLLLRAAVERRLLSDVPLGVLLSGGIDSSITATLAAQLAGRGQVKSFAIGFRDRRFDESVYAEEVATLAGTDHRCRYFEAEDVVDAVDAVLRQIDEPFADPSVLPTAMLCKFAREEVTVALGGDGGDELFAGYDTFEAVRHVSLARRLIPKWAAAAINGAVEFLPTDSSRSHMPLEFKVRRFLRGYRLRGADMLTAWQGPFDAPGLDRLLPDFDWRALTEPVERSMLPFGSEIDAALHWYQTVYLPDDILVKGDRASMLNSLELRSPFLDIEVAEFANSLPTHMKIRGKTRKYLLRELIREWERDGTRLPSHVLNRPKKGFGIPIAAWLRGPLRDRMIQIVLEEWPTSLNFVSEGERRRLVRVHLTGSENVAKELWSLLALAWWSQSWID